MHDTGMREQQGRQTLHFWCDLGPNLFQKAVIVKSKCRLGEGCKAFWISIVEKHRT